MQIQASYTPSSALWLAYWYTPVGPTHELEVCVRLLTRRVKAVTTEAAGQEAALAAELALENRLAVMNVWLLSSDTPQLAMYDV